VVDAAANSLGEFGQATCNYGNSTSNLTVQISLAEISKTDFEKGFQNRDPQAVPNLGDAAFYSAGQLSTLKGKVVLLIFVINPAKGSETLSNATILTQKVLTALEKTNHASDLNSTVSVGNSNPVTASDIPVYPGSVRVNDDATSGSLIATFTSTDSFPSIVSWFKKVVTGKSWTVNTALEPEADYTILSVGKFTADTSSRLLVSIEGLKKADRGTISDNNGNPVVLNPNDTLILVTLSGKQ